MRATATRAQSPTTTAALLAQIRAERMRREGRQRRSLYVTDALAWARDCIDWRGAALQSYQEEVLGDFYVRRRVAIRAPHGVGKTTTAALLVLQFALTQDEMGGAAEEDWKAVTTASVWRQLEHYLWPEIHKWSRRLRWEKLGREPFDVRTELLSMILQLRHGRAFAVASDKASSIEGAHARRLLYIFDEAKAIPAGTWDAAEGALMSGNACALAISTPAEPSGRFYDVHARRPGYEDWWTRHVTLDEAIVAHRRSDGKVGIDPTQAEQRRRQWGESSPIYRMRVLGEFASLADGVIPLAWVEEAIERWREWDRAGRPVAAGALTALGVDVGLTDDMTVIAHRIGFAIERLDAFGRGDPMETAGRVVAALDAQGGTAVIDADGIGAGVYQRVVEQQRKALAFRAGSGTDLVDKSGQVRFANLRAAAWWRMRELLEPDSTDHVMLPPDDALTGELVAPRWRMTSTGRILIEEKAAVKARIGRSTDHADAVMHAFALEVLQGPARAPLLAWTAGQSPQRVIMAL